MLIIIKTLSLLINQAHHCLNYLRKAKPCKLAIIAKIYIYSILSFYKAYILRKIIQIIIHSLIIRIMQIVDLFYINFVKLITFIRYNKVLYFQIAINNYLHIEYG